MNFRFLNLIIMLLLLATPTFSASITYEYDDLDRLHMVTLENGQKIIYDYDEIGNMTSKMPSGNVVTISAGVTGSGSIYPKGNTTITVGGSKTYSFVPSTGYKIANIYVDGIAQGAITSYSFANLAASHTISAAFTIYTYTITTSSGSNGTISPTTSVINYGSSKTFTITPATGYHIANVVVDGVSQGAVSSYTFSNVTSGHTISATFTINTYAVNFVAGANGTLIGTTNQTINYNGSTTAITAVPATGYHFVNWTGTGGFVTTTANPLTVSNVRSAQTITANFAINTGS